MPDSLRRGDSQRLHEACSDQPVIRNTSLGTRCAVELDVRDLRSNLIGFSSDSYCADRNLETFFAEPAEERGDFSVDSRSARERNPALERK